MKFYNETRKIYSPGNELHRANRLYAFAYISDGEYMCVINPRYWGDTNASWEESLSWGLNNIRRRYPQNNVIRFHGNVPASSDEAEEDSEW